MDEFETELGKVAVTESHIERERSDSDAWKLITETYDPNDIVDKVHFSKIDDLDVQYGAIYPVIKMKVDGDWKYFFFHDDNKLEQVYKRLNYRWKSFRQVFD